ncbi:MAG: peptide-methionine (R)-S-oxide reductase MsrB [Alphaproteobacteria bacterium]|nr:peptide-methionine (R)-S-oxide reductase MsrB [Alphaproteobacteria bacterium]
MKRRTFMTLALGSAVYIGTRGVAFAQDAKFEVLKKSDAEWKKLLPPEQYHILREEGTEAPFTSKWVDEHRAGTFHCAGCDLPLFKSETKFDSGTGWPSFFDGIKGHIETKDDTSMFMKRTEFHCAKCGGHHGHVFDDGPKPTGLRYCSNGAVLKFITKGA